MRSIDNHLTRTCVVVSLHGLTLGNILLCISVELVSAMRHAHLNTRLSRLPDDSLLPLLIRERTLINNLGSTIPTLCSPLNLGLFVC